MGYKGVDYYVGPSPDSVVLNLVNDQDFGIRPIWNVIGTINGTLDETVILGNHRDAWIAGGASDPNSGSAALNEVVRSFGTALKDGWRPLRTLVFGSWDAEEYALIGSTEWVEEYLPWLNSSAIAYLNVDAGTSGPTFWAALAPLLKKTLFEATDYVPYPGLATLNQSVFDVWNKDYKTLGSGSDFAAFQSYAGIPCIDMGFGHGTNGAIFHYHSNYDSWHWMSTYGDPDFHFHVTMARVWGVTAAILADTPIINYNASDYAFAMSTYLENMRPLAMHLNVSFTELEASLAALSEAAVAIDLEGEVLRSKIEDSQQTHATWETLAHDVMHRIHHLSNRYKYLERQFLYPAGLDGRNWYKHTVFVSEKWAGYAGVTFPGLVESLEDSDHENFYKWSHIISDELNKAAVLLQS